MSIEITRECPLQCPGCYAYADDHLGGELTLRAVRDFKGQELIDGVLGLTPCQFGGAPDCSNCGCVASAGLAALARHQLFGVIPVSALFKSAIRIGEQVKRVHPLEAQARASARAIVVNPIGTTGR